MSLYSGFGRFFFEFFLLAWSEEDWEPNKYARAEELALLLEFNESLYIQELFEHGEEWKAKFLEKKMGKYEIMYIYNSRKCCERNTEKLLREAKMPQTRIGRVWKTTTKSASNKKQKNKWRQPWS